VQRQNNWDASLLMMKKALQIDPSLSMDVDFFYELILGTQPVGYRGVSKIQSFDEKSTRFQDLVSGSVDQVDRNTRKQTLGTSNYALGLAAYHLGPRSLFRRYFARALAYRPELFFNVDLLGMYFKSFLSQEQLKKLKKVMDRHS
jgi:hypothetical protein